MNVAAASQTSSSQSGELVIFNRRFNNRVSANVALECRYSDGSVCAGTSINISPTGVRVVLRGGSSEPSGEMTLRFGKDLELKAHRVWRQETAFGTSRVVGLAFDAPSRQQQDQLRRLLSYQGRLSA